MKITYYGDGAKKIIILNGWAACCEIWQPLISKLILTHQIIVIDFLDNNELINDLLNYWLDGIVPLIDDETLVMAWSMGGLVALSLIFRYPKLFNRLIMISATPYFITTESWPGIDKKFFENFSYTLKRNIQQALDDFLRLCCYRDRKVYADKEIFRQCFQVQNNLQRSLSLMQDLDFRHQLFQIKQKTLWIFAEYDSLVPAKLAIEIKNILPQARALILPRVGHIPFWSCADQLLELILEFCHEV